VLQKLKSNNSRQKPVGLDAAQPAWCGFVGFRLFVFVGLKLIYRVSSRCPFHCRLPFYCLLLLLPKPSPKRLHPTIRPWYKTKEKNYQEQQLADGNRLPSSPGSP
jgi:hypothetical protein